MPNYWCANFVDKDILEHGIELGCWMMQYQYDDDLAATVTKHWKQVGKINAGDWLVAYLRKNTFFAIGKVRTPRRPSTPNDPQVDIESYIERRQSYDYKSGYVYYTPVFYEDFDDEWRRENGDRFPQRIDVEEWLHYAPSGVEVRGLGKYPPYEIQKAIFNIKKEDFNEIRDKLAETKTPNGGLEVKPPPADTMETLLEQFRQIIAYGPPGTGKTREAKRVALALLSGKEPKEDANEDDIERLLESYRKDNRFALVVFHPAYEYEQFVGGIEPNVIEGKVAFDTKPGVFLRLCRKAKDCDKPCVLIIDEINRGNLPKLLGELIYALEYRGHEVSLPFICEGSDKLIVPKNLYIIATMNSADRSIGHIDVAIRRRFALYPLEPNSDVIQNVWRKIGDENYGSSLARVMAELNEKLKAGNDSNAELEAGVGHSYFLPIPGSSVEDAKIQVGRKWTYQILPLLREYALLNPSADSLRTYFDKSLEDALPRL